MPTGLLSKRPTRGANGTLTPQEAAIISKLYGASGNPSGTPAGPLAYPGPAVSAAATGGVPDPNRSGLVSRITSLFGLGTGPFAATPFSKSPVSNPVFGVDPAALPYDESTAAGKRGNADYRMREHAEREAIAREQTAAQFKANLEKDRAKAAIDAETQAKAQEERDRFIALGRGASPDQTLTPDQAYLQGARLNAAGLKSQASVLEGTTPGHINAINAKNAADTAISGVQEKNAPALGAAQLGKAQGDAATSRFFGLGLGGSGEVNPSTGGLVSLIAPTGQTQNSGVRFGTDAKGQATVTNFSEVNRTPPERYPMVDMSKYTGAFGAPATPQPSTVPGTGPAPDLNPLEAPPVSLGIPPSAMTTQPNTKSNLSLPFPAVPGNNQISVPPLPDQQKLKEKESLLKRLLTIPR